MDIAGLPDDEVLRLWVASMDELRRRGLVRSANNPVGDYAESLVAKCLGIDLVGKAMEGYDAISTEGVRYQIKGRRLKRKGASLQLGVIRSLDQTPFDYLVVVLFDQDFGTTGIWQLPIDLVREHATYRAYVNGHIVYARASLLNDPRAKRLDCEPMAK